MPSPRSRHRTQHPSRVVIVAAAGYGKSTSLDADLAPAGVRRSAAALRAAPLPTALRLGIEDLHRLAPAEQGELLDRVSALPADVTVTLTSRTPLAPESRARLGSEVYDRGPHDLALTLPAVVRLLADGYAVQDPETAAHVHRLTGGWPALVHLAADAVARRPDEDLWGALTGPGTAAATWVTAEVLDGMPERLRDLCGLIGEVGPLTPHLCDQVLPGAGSATVDGLRRTGLLLPRRRLRREELWLVPLVAGVLAAARDARHDDVLRWSAVARGYESEGLSLPAARAFSRAGEHGEVERLVRTHGQVMIRQGEAAAVASLVASLPSAPAADLLVTHSDALRMSGDAAAALRTLSPLVEQADRTGWTVSLASRVAALHHMRGDLPAALAAFDRVDAADVPLDRDGLEWRAGRVHVLASLGRTDDARAMAVQTLAVAERSGQPGPLAAAHLAMARTSSASRKEAHHEQALEAATADEDVATACRVLVNQSCLLLGAARYGEACAVAREAVRLAEIGSQTGRYAAALHNLGEALTRVGEYDEAKWQLQRGVALCRRLGPGRAVGLLGLAEIQRELGNDEQARVAYTEAAELAREANEVQVLVQALSGFARVPSSIPGAALAAAREAQRITPPSHLPFALHALARVALAEGRRDEAVERAEAAVAAARAVHAFDVLAESLETLGLATDDPGLARRSLAEAHALWQEGGAVPGAARLEVLLGRLDHADGAARSRARQASRQLQRMGILRLNGTPLSEDPAGLPVAIRVLGGFEVRVDRVPLPLPVWRSRQARTLVKILAGRRGRPVTRARLCELLWPDDDPARTGHRLSVLLATVRGVLDPGKAWPTDHHLAADQRGIWLDLRHVDLDADRLLRDAALAAELMDAGERDRAREILTDIDDRYRGDAFEDEPYEEWADGFREEVRASWQRSLRRLASLHSREGRVADAQVLLVRLLGADPYDAPMHRLLVSTLARAGRYGEAQRAFTRWADAMAAIAAPPPDPGVLVASALTPR